MNNQRRISLFLCALLLITTLMSACTGTKPTDSSLPAGDASTSTNTDTSNGTSGIKNYKFADITDSIKLIGRTEVTDRGIYCDATASGFEFNATLTGDVTMTVMATKPTYFTVFIDGVRQEERVYTTGNSQAPLKIASFAQMGTHTIRVLKQTEPQLSLCYLALLSFEGTLGEKPADREHYIEFIGDSITSGYGNLCENGTPGAATARYQDGTATYAFLTAQTLEADHSVVSCSGIGLAKGYMDFRMAEYYPVNSYYRDKTQAYPYARVPDLVVINLGTNDTANGAGERAVKDAAAALITSIRTGYQTEVPIVWAYNMMSSGGSRWISRAIAELGGEQNGLYMCELNRNGNGGNGHPSGEAHVTAAGILSQFIKDKNLLD